MLKLCRDAEKMMREAGDEPSPAALDLGRTLSESREMVRELPTAPWLTALRRLNQGRSPDSLRSDDGAREV